MNIVHLEDEPWDSGIAHYALTLAAEQARRGHRVAFWGVTGSPVLKTATALGLPVHNWTAGHEGWLEIPALRRELAELQPSVVNAHTGSTHALALLIAPRDAAVVRTRGDARPVHATTLTRWAAGRTHGFIAANSTIQAQLRAAFPESEASLVSQGIEGPAAVSSLPAAPHIGIIARLDPVKGHETLLDSALALKLRYTGLQVLCAGEGQLAKRLAWQLPARGLDGVVKFLGRVPDRWPFLADCLIGVVASTGSEAVSRAALEWMAAGRPLVATRVGGIPDLVVDGTTGILVPPGDADALTAALKSLLDAPARAAEMGRAGRARWQAYFSPAPFYESTQRAYEAAINALSRRR
jgi:glycosyltransferase involved in cell wall biosynthesis